MHESLEHGKVNPNATPHWLSSGTSTQMPRVDYVRIWYQDIVKAEGYYYEDQGKDKLLQSGEATWWETGARARAERTLN